MRNKKNIAVRLTVLAAAVFGATLAHAATTVTPGVLKVGMEITYPPFESYDEKKNVVGSDPELAHMLAKHMNLKADFVDTKFSSLILSLNAGHYDAIISGMSDLASRHEASSFVDYLRSGPQFFVQQSRADAFAARYAGKVAELDGPGLVAAMQVGTSGQITGGVGRRN